MKFENIGVFLSFISYPYYKDGKKLFNKIFDPFFAEHKRRISQFDSDVPEEGDPYQKLYQPAGYRMFGSSGLAILSLVDDYSFYNRFFNKNHIQSLLQEKRDEQLADSNSNNKEYEKDEIELDFNSVVISGVVEHESKGRTLFQIADNTFLQSATKKRYHYIGIIRLKIDYRLLVGKDNALETVTQIKKRINDLFSEVKAKNSRCDYFAMDCYDNDELTVVAFSDKLLTLYNFLGNIRSIKASDIHKSFSKPEVKNDDEKHVFGLTYLCFGYDWKKKFGKDLGISDRINCSVETKPGHRDAFYEYISQKSVSEELGISQKNVNISGGCRIFFTMPLKSITLLEKKCIDPTSVFCRDIRNIKVSLIDIIDDKDRDISQVSNTLNRSKRVEEATIERPVFSDVKATMKKVGVSKMVRERLLALLEFYNLSSQDILQRFYLMELKPALLNFENIIRELKEESNESLDSVEQVLNEKITNMENACYDRLHIQKSDHAPLEYSGGIQQYLTSFDFVYKQIYGLFSPKDKDAYITISGAERAASDRTLFKLNIHDIIFPELFITTVWKEISNFTLKSQRKNAEIEEGEPHKDLLDRLNTWHDFTKNANSFNIIRDRIHHSEQLLRDDEVTKRVKNAISSELIEYFIKDFVVFHFAFCRDYKLFCHFYLKILLQTTNCYLRLNHIDKGYLITMLLRIFMVERLASSKEKEGKLKDYLIRQSNVPFDYILSSSWLECYSKTLEATAVIYDVLECYGFCEMVDYTIEAYESNLFVKENEGELFDPKKIKTYFQERCQVSYAMLRDLCDGYLIQESPKTTQKPITFIICLFVAYLKAVYMLDYKDRSKTDSLVKSVPRNSDGTILNDPNSEFHIGGKRMLQILVDTTGGFFIPSSKVRRLYFCLRTALYRSLWNYRFVNGIIA